MTWNLSPLFKLLFLSRSYSIGRAISTQVLLYRFYQNSVSGSHEAKIMRQNLRVSNLQEKKSVQQIMQGAYNNKSFNKTALNTNNVKPKDKNLFDDLLDF